MSTSLAGPHDEGPTQGDDKERTMPLHDWSNLPGWDGVHQVWLVELLYWIKPRLPGGYRAYIETTPTFAIGAPADDRPDVGVRDWPQANGPTPAPEPLAARVTDSGEQPDQEVAVAALTGEKAVFVEQQGRLIAAVELVSPRNKDRPAACAAYTSTYVGYLLKGVHLLLVDVHRRPLRFSFADRISEELHLDQPPCPALPARFVIVLGSRPPAADVFWPAGAAPCR